MPGAEHSRAEEIQGETFSDLFQQNAVLRGLELQHNCNTNCNTATQRCNLQGKGSCFSLLVPLFSSWIWVKPGQSPLMKAEDKTQIASGVFS